MSFGVMFSVGATALSAVSNVLVGSRQKKMLKQQRNNQAKVINAEFNYNKNQLEKEYISGTMINFENISNAMNEATTQVLSNLSAYNLNTIDLGGGSSYNSSKSELVSSMENDYNIMMTNLISERDYTEYALTKNMNDSMYQLELNKNKQLYGLDVSYTASKNAINDKMLSSIFQTSGDIIDIFKQEGGVKNVFSKGKNDTTFSNFLSSQLGLGGVK